MFSRSRKTSVRQESKRRRSSDPRQGSSCLQLFERSRTTSGRQESKTASIIKVLMSNYFAQRPLFGSSKSLSPRSPRRIIEVSCLRFAQRPPSDPRSPFLYFLRPETSRRILQVPFSIAPRDPPVGSSKSLSPRPPPSDPRSPLLYLINYLIN